MEHNNEGFWVPRFWGLGFLGLGGARVSSFLGSGFWRSGLLGLPVSRAWLRVAKV